ncbi:hypothetical protein PSTT_15507, partial [Puccinia striiformis]
LFRITRYFKAIGWDADHRCLSYIHKAKIIRNLMGSLAAISRHSKWMALVAPMAVSAKDDSKCSWTVGWSNEEKFLGTARETCDGLSVVQILAISLIIAISTLLVLGLFAFLFRERQRRANGPSSPIFPIAWPSLSRRGKRPTFQPLGTPAPESPHEIQLPEKAVYHI